MSFQEIIDKAPQDIKKEMDEKPLLKALLESIYHFGKIDARTEMAEYLKNATTVQLKFLDKMFIK